MGDERESIWSVSNRWVWVYYLAFTLQLIPVLINSVWIELRHNTGDSAMDTYLAIGQNVGPHVISAAGLSLIAVLIGEMMIMIAEPFLKWRERAGREKGREDERAEWVAWLERKNAAEDRGEPFDEPSPAERDRTPK